MEPTFDRKILHCDCNSFFASVELLSRPELREMPVAVGGDSSTRHGIILAKNEPAKRYGIKTAETIWQAKKKCPELIILSPHYDLYSEYSKVINGIYLDYTDLVEPFGIDESWLDVTNTYRFFASSAKELADGLRERIKRETGLTISVGVSFNKIFAKLGSDYKKPDATTVIDKDNYQTLVWELPVQEMIFIGASTQKTLNEMGIRTLGELARVSRETLVSRFGRHGEDLYINANGLDTSPVKSYYGSHRERKSVGHGKTFSRDLTELGDIKAALHSLSEEVGTRLRRYGLYANGVQLTVREPDFTTYTRQEKLESTCLTEPIYRMAVKLYEEHRNKERPVRALTVTAIDTSSEMRAVQTSLFEIEGASLASEEELEKQEKLQESIDRIRAKFGKDSLKSGSVITKKELESRKHDPFGDKRSK